MPPAPGSGQGRGGYGLARILAYVTGTVDQKLLVRNEYLAAGPAPNVIRHGIDLPSRAEAGRGVAGAGRSPDVARRRVPVPGKATTNPERERGAEGGLKREHADDGMTGVSKTLCFPGFLNFKQGQALSGSVVRKPIELKTASALATRPYKIEEQVGYLLRRAHQRASAIFQVTIGDPNVTATQYSSMAKLNEYRELSQSHLGRLVGMDKATMQGVVRRLKERGLVDSRPDPGDARRTLLSLTTDGQQTINRLLVNGPAVSRETLKPIAAEDQHRLLELLLRIA